MYRSELMTLIKEGESQEQIGEQLIFTNDNEKGNRYEYTFPSGVMIMGTKRKFVTGSLTYSVQKLKLEAGLVPKTPRAPRSAKKAATTIADSDEAPADAAPAPAVQVPVVMMANLSRVKATSV